MPRLAVSNASTMFGAPLDKPGPEARGSARRGFRVVSCSELVVPTCEGLLEIGPMPSPDFSHLS